MTNNRILQIIREEVTHQNNFILEGVTYSPKRGYRNNQLIEIHGRNRELLTEDWNSFAPKATAILDGLGLLPGVGELFNGISGLVKFSIDDVVGGAISFIGAIPFVGKFLGAPFRLIHKFVGKYVEGGLALLTKAFTFLKNGKMGEAAKKLLEVVGNLAKNVGGNKDLLYIKTAIDKMYKFIQTSASKINGGIDNIIPGIESFIRKVTFGLVEGIPTAMKQALTAVFNQIKAFFTGLGSGKLYQTTKNVTKKAVTSNLTKKEEEEIVKTYNTKVVKDAKLKKRYPTVKDYLQAQSNAKENKEKSVELKLWSSGPLVEKLQKILQLKVDGKFGEGTELAVKKWQKKNGLVQDGVVGPDTWAKMT